MSIACMIACWACYTYKTVPFSIPFFNYGCSTNIYHIISSDWIANIGGSWFKAHKRTLSVWINILLTANLTVNNINFHFSFHAVAGRRFVRARLWCITFWWINVAVVTWQSFIWPFQNTIFHVIRWVVLCWLRHHSFKINKLRDSARQLIVKNSVFNDAFKRKYNLMT